MAATDVNVTIGFTVETKQLKDANDLLNDMISNLEKYNSIKGMAPINTTTSVGAIRETANQMLNIKKSVEQTKQPAEALVTVMDKFSAMELDDIKYQFRDIKKQLDIGTTQIDAFWSVLQKRLPNNDLDKFGKIAKKTYEDMGMGKINASVLADKTLLVAAALKEVAGQTVIKGETGLDAYFKIADYKNIPKKTARSIHSRFEDVFTEKPVSQIPDGEGEKTKSLAGDYGILEEALKSLREEQKQAAVVKLALANADKLAEAPMQSLERVTKQQSTTLIDNVQKVRQLGDEYKIFRAYIRGARSVLGPVGMAFREISSQLYWASLGFLFLSMTMSRAERSHVTMLSRVNDLSKSIYNLKQLELDAMEATYQYGVGSREAARTSAQLKMAQNDLVIQQKMLAVSIKTEILQNWQSQISLLPVIVNSMQLVLTVYQAAGGVMAAHTAQTTQSAMASIINAGAKKTEASAGLLAAYSTHQGAAANVTLTGTTPGAIAGLKGLSIAFMGTSIAAKFLIGALTMGIGAVIAFTLSSIMAAKAQAETDAMMKKMDEDAKRAADSFGDLESSMYDVGSWVTKFAVSIREVSKSIDGMTSAIDGASYALEGGSLTEAFEAAIDKGVEFNKVMKSVSDTRVVYSVTGQIDALPLLTEEVVLEYSPVKFPELDILDKIVNIQLYYSDVPNAPEIPEIFNVINLSYLIPDTPILNDLQQKVILEYVTKDLPVLTQTVEVQKNVNNISRIEEVGNNRKGNVVVNVSFPNLTIREEADIQKIAKAIDSRFQYDYYADGGRV